MEPSDNSSSSSHRQVNWNKIWSLNCLPKVKTFIWKACHNAVPTYANLAKRHHSRYAGCPRCGDDQETLEHLMFLCPFSQAVWRASELSYNPSSIGLGSFAQWWSATSSMDEQSFGGLDQNLLAWTIWNLWKARNLAIFEKAKLDPVLTWNRTLNEMQEYDQATTTTSSTNQVRFMNENWEPPDVNVIKINCDASFNASDKITGIFADARNHDRVVVDGTNTRTLAPNAFVAECLALRLGSKLIVQHGWNNVVLESDCKMAIMMLNDRMSTSWEVAAVLNDVKEIGRNHNVSFSFVPRNANCLADWLAKATAKGTCTPNWMNYIPTNLY